MSEESPSPPPSRRPPPAPPNPADRHPLRTYDIALKDLEGLEERELLQALGEPDGRTRYIRSDGPRDVTFGPPAPEALAAGVPYEIWNWHNVRGSTWCVYLSRYQPGEPPLPPSASARFAHGVALLIRAIVGGLPPSPPAPGAPSRPRRVVMVWSYPTGAIF